MAGQGSFALLSGDDGGDALVLEPAEEAAQLGAQDELVGQAGEQGLDGVQHHPFGADGVDGVAQADEQALQIVLAGLFDLAALDIDEIQGEQLLFFQVRQVEAQGGDVLGQFLRVSSKDMKTPGSRNSVAPRTRNSMASRVLPQPAPPQTRVGRPLGRPPPVISSSPWMPVGHLANCRRESFFAHRFQP